MSELKGMVANTPHHWQYDSGAFVLTPSPLPSQVGIRFAGRGAGLHPTATMEQVHGGTVRRATEPVEYPQCDGLVTTRPNLLLRIKTADCVPIVLWRPGCLAVCHAGWRGFPAGVLEATLTQLGAPDRAHAFIGPCIRACCFEVGNDVSAHFPKRRHRPGEKDHVDLPGEARDRLVAAGVASLWDSGLCTRCNQHLLHSHRGSGGAPGRNLTYAVLNQL